MGMFSDPADRFRFEPKCRHNDQCCVTTCDAKGDYEWDGDYYCLDHYEDFIEDAHRQQNEGEDA